MVNLGIMQMSSYINLCYMPLSYHDSAFFVMGKTACWGDEGSNRNAIWMKSMVINSNHAFCPNNENDEIFL